MICFAILFHLTVKISLILPHKTVFDNISKELKPFKDKVFSHAYDNRPFTENVIGVKKNVEAALIGNIYGINAF